MAAKTTRTDYFADGEWNASCYECGRKFKSGELKKHWQGYYVCPEHWEPRHPQDFLRAVRDDMSVPWAQPINETFTAVCTLSGRTAYIGCAVVGCAIVGYHPPGFNPNEQD